MNASFSIPLGRTPLGDKMLDTAKECLRVQLSQKQYLEECRIAWNEACDALKIVKCPKCGTVGEHYCPSDVARE